MRDEDIIRDLKDHNMGALQYLYQEYRREFVKWAAFAYNIDEAEGDDIFSDAVIDTYQNVISEKYVKSETATLKSYLFEVGKNKILKLLNKQKVSDFHLMRMAMQMERPGNEIADTEISRETVEKIKELIALLDIRCRKVLTLFYFHGLSMEEIASEMEFKSVDVAKNKKLKCLRRMQQLAFERYARTDFLE
jgi:RNA polymerase sigma factor (sigma-70 family)